MNELEKLEEYKEKVERAKTKKANLSGQQEQLFNTTHNCNTTEEAEEKIEENDRKLSNLTEEITKRFTTLKESYDWDNM